MCFHTQHDILQLETGLIIPLISMLELCFVFFAGYANNTLLVSFKAWENLSGNFVPFKHQSRLNFKLHVPLQLESW
jgi:hypothetical protein